jgi:hypothetical protein
MPFFSHDYRKSVIEWHVELLRSFNLSDKTIGFYIRSMHVHTPVYLIIAMLYCGNYFIALSILICLGIAFAFFVMFDGCVLSKIEQALDDQDITIVDPFLEMLGIEKTKTARMRISLLFAVGYMILMVGIFYWRFHRGEKGGKGILPVLEKNLGIA